MFNIFFSTFSIFTQYFFSFINEELNLLIHFINNKQCLCPGYQFQNYSSLIIKFVYFNEVFLHEKRDDDDNNVNNNNKFYDSIYKRVIFCNKT